MINMHILAVMFFVLFCRCCEIGFVGWSFSMCLSVGSTSTAEDVHRRDITEDQTERWKAFGIQRTRSSQRGSQVQDDLYPRLWFLYARLIFLPQLVASSFGGTQDMHSIIWPTWLWREWSWPEPDTKKHSIWYRRACWWVRTRTKVLCHWLLYGRSNHLVLSSLYSSQVRHGLLLPCVKIHNTSV